METQIKDQSKKFSFTTVTWYSQVTAIMLALAIFAAGFYVGLRYGEVRGLNDAVQNLDATEAMVRQLLEEQQAQAQNQEALNVTEPGE